MLQLSDIVSKNFKEATLDVFKYQARNNKVYKQYLNHLKCEIDSISEITEIPFLPISFFKTHQVTDIGSLPKLCFLSSGTGDLRSKHYIRDPELYKQSFISGFEKFYGDLNDWRLIALLPSYRENPHSSLIYMMDSLIESTSKNGSKYLNDASDVANELKKSSGKKTLCLGVSFALLDLAEKFPGDYSDVIFMETGGMKGKRKELTREDMHEQLCTAFKVERIHSEYGMSELLSQAYSTGNGVFKTPPWMKVLVRPPHEPFSEQSDGRGVLKVIDLANYHSCSFIETQDLGKVNTDGSFEVLGRLDHAELRGCNLMVY